jgi:hypothetical protein
MPKYKGPAFVANFCILTILVCISSAGLTVSQQMGWLAGKAESGLRLLPRRKVRRANVESLIPPREQIGLFGITRIELHLALPIVDHTDCQRELRFRFQGIRPRSLYIRITYSCI